MNNNVLVIRSPEVIAAEINTIKRSTAKYVLEQSIEIGRLLCEAKKSVPHGEWGHWLEERCAYSTSNANNLMRIYTEYGENEDQLSFFEENKLELYGDLNRSQAIALLALPPTERAEFVKSNDVPSMSVSELESKIKEVKAETEAAVRAEMEEAIKKAEAEVGEQKRRADKNAADLEKVKKNPELKKVQQKLWEAENAVETLRDVSEKAAKNAELMKNENAILREQLSQPAITEITEEQRKAIIAEANSQMSADLAAKDAELENIKGKMAQMETSFEPTVQMFSIYFEAMQESFNKMMGLIRRCENPETADKLKNAILKTLEILRDTL